MITLSLEKTRNVCETLMPHAGNIKFKGQGRNVIYFGTDGKVLSQLRKHLKYESPIYYGSKVMTKVKYFKM